MLTTSFCGAAGEVTGSGYWLDTGEARILVDFGFFQGGRDSAMRNRVISPVRPRELVAAVLTHAHVDHSGRLPLLAAQGARAPVFATPATLELAEVLLFDSARIAEEDSARANRKLRRAGRIESAPLYSTGDVESLLRRCVALPYHEWQEIAPGVAIRFFDAGHILGSASVEMEIERPRQAPLRMVFSGDLGTRDAPILIDPEIPPPADVVFLESTYGDRVRPSRTEAVAAFRAILQRAVAEQKQIIVPAFAVGRTQTLMYELAQAFREGIVPAFPVFLDSPMASRASAIYARHAELHDSEARALGRRGQIPETLRVIENAEQSRLLNDSSAFCMIVSASGMCEGGRVMHHLRHKLWRRDVMVLLPGYMAPDTLGRQLAEGAREVEIFDEPVAVRAEVIALDGFSAHADQNGLLAWLAPQTVSRPRIILTHGEDPAREALAQRIEERFDLASERPTLDDVLSFD